MDAGSRERLYSTWLDESRVHGSSSLRDNISQSLQKVQEFIRKNAGAEITNEAGAKSPSFFNVQNIDIKENSTDVETADTAPDAAAATNSSRMGNAHLPNSNIAGFSENVNSESPVDYRNLQNISYSFYCIPEGNTVEAKQNIEEKYANAQNKYDVFPGSMA